MPENSPEIMSTTVDSAAIELDASQMVAAQSLQQLAGRLEQQQSMLQRLGTLLTNRENTPSQGVYLWGGVGRGKTLLMDRFYNELSVGKKIRTHFHRLMHAVHNELKSFKHEKNPLQAVAKQFATRYRIICLDEFHALDIGDAMILSGLLNSLFAEGTALVTTSNRHPDDLYKNGLQRARFLPAIDLIKQSMQVVEVDAGIDYRLRALSTTQVYNTPLGDASEAVLQTAFDRLVGAAGSTQQGIKIQGRIIDTRQHADEVVWFEFADICGGPRSTNDYIEVARCYNTVLISNIPVMENRDDEARRFINLIDELYDRRVKLFVSAAAPMDTLYRGKRLVFQFNRTTSRLHEMQTREYLAEEHRP